MTASHTNVILRNHVHALDRAWPSEARTRSGGVSNAVDGAVRDVGKTGTAASPRRHRRTGADAVGSIPCLSHRYATYGPLAAGLVIAALEAMTMPAGLLILGFEESLEEREFVEQRIAVSPKRAAIQLEINPGATRFREAAGSVRGPHRERV